MNFLIFIAIIILFFIGFIFGVITTTNKVSKVLEDNNNEVPK